MNSNVFHDVIHDLNRFLGCIGFDKDLNGFWMVFGADKVLVLITIFMVFSGFWNLARFAQAKR